MASRKRVPLGKAIRWTEAEIDEFSQIAIDDIQRMRATWKRYAPRAERDLIDATEQDTTADGITATT